MTKNVSFFVKYDTVLVLSCTDDKYKLLTSRGSTATS